MAHNLNIRPNGTAAFVTKKQLAWHGLGVTFNGNILNSREAIELGGLDFTIEKRPLYAPGAPITFEEAKKVARIQRRIVRDEKGEFTSTYNQLHLLDNQYATVRTDTNTPLGIVGNKYTIVQNIDAFDFFDSIAEDGIADYETAGALGNGEIVFITAKVKDSMTIHTDQIDKYLLISLSHDGSAAITVGYTPIRVVCNNTLTLALKGLQNKVSIRHTKSAHDKLQAAKATLGLIQKGDNNHYDIFNRLLDVKITENKVIDLLLETYKIDSTNLSTKGRNIIESNFDYYLNGLGQKEYVGTGWGAYNTVTGYLHNMKNYTSLDSKYKSVLQSNQQILRDNLVSTLLTI